MPIKSYLAHAVEGGRDELARMLRGLAGCAIVPATNRDVVVLVTDTPDDAAEQELQDALSQVPGLQYLTLVAGLADSGASDDGLTRPSHHCSSGGWPPQSNPGGRLGGGRRGPLPCGGGADDPP